MRHILLMLLFVFGLGLWACNNEKGGDSPIGSPEKMSFKATIGGAMMYYTLPSDPDVVGINVRYRNAFGQDVLRVGSTAVDSLALIGFKEAQSSVSAQVTLSYYNGVESQPVDVTFSTADSGPVSFMKSLECHPNWEGFSLSYEIPEGATGIAHVFYLGTDPLSNRQDTLLINSFFLEETKEPGFKSYKIKQDIPEVTVIVKAEDFLGFMVEEKEWQNVTNMVMAKLDASNFTFFCNNSIEDETYKFGAKYLFDGDTKGEITHTDNRYHTFLAGPDACGEHAQPMYLDLKKNRIAASVRIYNLIKTNTSRLGWSNNHGWPALLLKVYNGNEMPCKVTIYGLKDNGSTPSSYSDIHSLEGWVKIGSFEQNKSAPQSTRWCKNSWHGLNMENPAFSLEQLRAAEPEFADIMMPVQGQEEGFRFLKMVINETFNLVSAGVTGSTYFNTDNYVTFHQLEVYTSKD